jgi:hypothetical protein
MHDIKKPSGWVGKRTDMVFTKNTQYGVKYMCTDCGRQVLGVTHTKYMHRKTCCRLTIVEPDKPNALMLT